MSKKMPIDEAWERITAMAEQHALVYRAFGGVVVLVHPDEQKRQGIYDQCQYMAGKKDSPESAQQELIP